MKTILTLLFCCCFAPGYCQDTLYWSKDYQLSWSDFRGNADAGSGFLASSSSGIIYHYKYAGNTASFVAEAFFIRHTAWRKLKADTSLLKHEQGHFDITEIFARKMTKTMQLQKAKTLLNEKQVALIADSIIAAKNAYQKKYDIETKNGTDKIMQQQWLQNISVELQR